MISLFLEYFQIFSVIENFYKQFFEKYKKNFMSKEIFSLRLLLNVYKFFYFKQFIYQLLLLFITLNISFVFVIMVVSYYTMS